MLMCPWPVGQQTNGKAPKSSELLLFSDVVIQVRPRMLSKQLKFVAMLWIRSSTSRLALLLFLRTARRSRLPYPLPVGGEMKSSCEIPATRGSSWRTKGCVS